MKPVLALLLGTALLAGCHKSGDEHAPAEPKDSLGSQLTLPHLFRGTLPCADCRGVDTRLELRADHRFILEERYQGRFEAESRHFYALGRFSQAGDKLRLDNSKRGPLFFQILNNHQIKMLDHNGQTIDSQLNYVLQTSDTALVPTARITMRGHYVNGDYTECESELSWPVQNNDGAAELAQIYADMGIGNGAPMYAEVDAHLVQETNDSTHTAQELLVIDQVGATAATQACAPQPL